MAFQTAGVAVSAAVTQVYAPAVVGTPTVYLSNTGTQPVYLGGSTVTYATGMPLYPSQNIDLPHAVNGLWAVCCPGTAGTSTTLSSNAAAGTAVVVATSATGFATGQTLQLGTGAAAETGIVSGVSGGTVTFASGIRFAHLSGEALALIAAPMGSVLTVLSGTA